MEIKRKNLEVKGIRFSAVVDDKEVGRVFLYILHNDIRNKKFGYFEDLFVEKEYRRQGIGSQLIKELIDLAKENNCYKIVATSRHGKDKVHEVYKKIGFADFGKEFKMYL